MAGEGTAGAVWPLGPGERGLWERRAEAQQKGAEEKAGRRHEHTGRRAGGLEKEVERNGKTG